MTYGIEVQLLNLLERSVTHGTMRTVQRYVDQWGLALSKSSSVSIREGYAALAASIREKLRIEEIHGAGAALNLDDPFVLQLVNAKETYFSKEEVEAAKRYRATLMDGVS